MKKVKKGAASFYIVSFATLFLTIIALSFAAVVISEVKRARDADLSQSAYDSALAGIEDAKIALLNYESCINLGYSSAKTPNPAIEGVTCEEIIYYMNNPDCDMVGHILGRIGKDESSKEVLVQEEYKNGTDNNMEQAYTCAEIQTDLSDYRAELTSENTAHVIPISVKNPTNIKYIRINWYSERNGTEFKFNNVNKLGISSFPILTQSQTSVPPTILVELSQTATSFSLKQLGAYENGKTNRASLTLVPYNNSAKNENQIVANADKYNLIKASDIAATNNQKYQNVPFMVECGEGNEFACTATLELPGVVPGVDGSTKRGPDTFSLTITIPYGQPDTDFSVELCESDISCDIVAGSVSEESQTESDLKTKFIGSQVKVDVTGRANDLYRRVEMRLGNENTYFPVATYALTALSEDDDAIKKTVTPQTQHPY